MKEVSLEDILLTLMKWRVQAQSPYNDGWTSEGYREMLEEVALACTDPRPIPKRTQERLAV
jgi:hypothetical protein